MSAVDRRMITAARVLVLASLLQAVVYAALGFDAYQASLRPFIFVWIAVPLALGYWLGAKLARTDRSFAVVLFGLFVAFAVSAWIYWDITWGRAAREESMSGLLFIFAPVYQFGWLAVVLLIAAVVGRIAPAR